MNPIKKKMVSLKLASTCIMPKGFDTYVAFLEGPMTRQVAKIKDKNAKKIAWVHNDISKFLEKEYQQKQKIKLMKKYIANLTKLFLLVKKIKKILSIPMENILRHAL